MKYTRSRFSQVSFFIDTFQAVKLTETRPPWAGFNAQDVSQEQVDALMNFWHAMGCPALAGWGCDPTVGNWEGVTVAGGNVTALELPGKGLSGSVGAALDPLGATLTHLALSGNPNLRWTGGYGVKWDQANDTYEKGWIIGGHWVPHDYDQYPVQANSGKRCLLADDGTVNYYLDPADSTKKANGDPAVLDGTDGQVMSEFPSFQSIRNYYDSNHYYYVIGIDSFSLILPDNSVVSSSAHAAFTKGGASVDYRYVGAYEAYNNGGVLCSISGVLPTVSQTRSTFRTQAEARGTGWHLFDVNLQDMLGMLYITMYADWDTQTQIGKGLTQYAAWPGGPQALTGNSNGIGNATGGDSWSVGKWAASTAYSVGDERIPTTANKYTYRCMAAGTTSDTEPTWPTTIGDTVTDGTVTWECVRSDQYMSFLGVENWYGHIWKMWDGVNVHNSTDNGSRLFLCDNYLHYADNTDANYTLAGLLPETDGWVSDVVDAAGFFPAAVGASSSTGVCDYYWTYFDNDPDIGWRVVVLGGRASNGSPAGAFFVRSSLGSSSAYSIIGGRLCY